MIRWLRWHLAALLRPRTISKDTPDGLRVMTVWVNGRVVPIMDNSMPSRLTGVICVGTGLFGAIVTEVVYPSRPGRPDTYIRRPLFVAVELRSR